MNGELSHRDLIRILEHDCLSKRDLLNCRYVNRLWRDASTSVLLQKNSCEIFFNVLEVPVPVPSAESLDVDVDAPTPAIVFCKDDNCDFNLENLTELISTSPQFPSTKLTYSSLNAWPGDLPTAPQVNQFFAKYGKEIKTLSILSSILSSDLTYLLFQLPNLESLDLVNCEFLQDDEVFQLTNNEYYGTIEVPIKALRIGRTVPQEIVREILVNAPLLKGIEDVNFSHVGILVEEAKIELMKDFNFCPYEGTVLASEYLAKGGPVLSKILVSFEDIIGVDVDGEAANFPRYVSALNAILESSKDSVEYLQLSINQSYPRGVIIPILKRLKSISLDIWGASANYPSPKHRIKHPSSSSIEQDQKREGDSDREISIFLFQQDDVISKIFPRLQKVKLKAEYYKCDFKLLGLFPHNENEPTKKHVSIMIPTVKELHIQECGKWPTIPEATSLQNLFPNIRMLKLKWKEIQRTDEDVMNSMWVFCPSVEYIEIYGVHNILPNQNQLYLMEHVDSFFTGVPVQLCEELRDKMEFSREVSCEIDIKPTMPSICDLKGLRELKVRFKKLSRPFASKITGELAFKSMEISHKTRFTFCYDPITVNPQDKENIIACLSPIAPYVTLVPEEFSEESL